MFSNDSRSLLEDSRRNVEPGTPQVATDQRRSPRLTVHQQGKPAPCFSIPSLFSLRGWAADANNTEELTFEWIFKHLENNIFWRTTKWHVDDQHYWRNIDPKFWRNIDHKFWRNIDHKYWRNIEEVMIRNVEEEGNEADGQVNGCDGHSIWWLFSWSMGFLWWIRIMISLIG